MSTVQGYKASKEQADRRKALLKEALLPLIQTDNGAKSDKFYLYEEDIDGIINRLERTLDRYEDERIQNEFDKELLEKRTAELNAQAEEKGLVSAESEAISDVEY